MSDRPIRIGFVCPTYDEHRLHDYTLGSLRSFFQHTAHGEAIVLDDASSGWTARIEQDLQGVPRHEGQSLYVERFAEWGGLTRSWNRGLQIARDHELDYVICGNNDVLFTPYWYEGLLHALENGYQLAGPLSNAAGITAKGVADVWRYVTDYRLTDDPDELKRVASRLRQQYAGMLVEAPVNGFFQIARTATWWEGAWSSDSVYCPRNDVGSSGRRNPTPLMTLNEDELQGRWRTKGWRTAVCMSSFIFHYRAVSRGRKYLRGRWFRMLDRTGKRS